MTARLLRLSPAGVFYTALLCVGVVAWAAGNYAFSPPTGWTNERSGSSGKWMDPTGVEVVALRATTFGGDLTAFANQTLKQGRASNPSQRVWTNKNYQLCGRHTGRYVIWTASNRRKNLIWEQVVALWGYDGYVVSYVRPATRPPSNVARASLLSICGAGSVPQQPGGVPVTPQRPPPPPQGQPAPPAGTATPYVYPSLYPRYAPVMPG